LKEEPVPAGKYDITKLGGRESYYRIRIGQVRLAYEVFWKEKLIIIHYVGWRESAYKNL
jgi:mRNA-degrading endonuclease RelE of RelBE toxin-antitoxin system